MKKTKIGIGAALIIALVFILTRLTIHNSVPAPESSSPETRVEVKVVKADAVADTLVFDARGKVTAKKSFSVTSLSEGKIKKVSVSVGEQVKSGQVIALLENSELDRELSVQNDKLQLSRKTVEDLEKKVKAFEEMLSLGIISENDFISLKQELNARKTEEHDLEITNGRLKSREKNYRIVTDTEGYISYILPQESFVTYGQTVAGIVSLQDEQIEAFIPFDQVNRPAPGDEALITCNSITIPGKVSNSFPSANSNLITVIVIPEKPIPMNLEVKVTFKVRAVNGLLIPKSAVVMVEGKPVIFLVKNNKAYKKDITVVKDYLDRALIVDDLGPDNVIVTENAYLLADSVSVVVK
ncbi:MAG: efflux RND transporter periplasmic adaptor subunit [Candidatus Latescibacter sp.]|nr:efflux RND transporter periplasmic adaptor subunit [Candidatus Latescibacter sp.]